MESYKSKSILSKIVVGGLFVAMLLENATGQSTHNSFLSKSVKDGFENNVSAIQAEPTSLKEEISKLSLNQDERMKEQQQILNAEISARNEQDKFLQSLIDAINSKQRFAAEIRSPMDQFDLPKGYINNFTEIFDVGNNFNPKTGSFRINNEDQFSNGNYIFNVNAMKYTFAYGDISVWKNQKPIKVIDIFNTEIMNSVFTLYLQKGDEVKLKNEKYSVRSRIIVTSDYPLTFTGYGPFY